MYRDGRGVVKNDFTAMTWFRKAADQGFAGAQCIVGFAYLQGQGAAKDESAAAEWYRKAAEQGSMDAQHHLGIMYRNGRGVDECHTTAVKWYRKAAQKGHADAQHNLAEMYYNGQGVTKSTPEAFKWYRMAAEQGNDLAINALANFIPGDTPHLDPPLPAGTHVELHGLQAKPELNGRRGVITKFVASSGRYSVQLDDDGSKIKVKPENLQQQAAMEQAANMAAKSGVVAPANIEVVDASASASGDGAAE